jgi:hypothetical protein
LARSSFLEQHDHMASMPAPGDAAMVVCLCDLFFGHFVFAIFCSGFHLFWPFFALAF